MKKVILSGVAAGVVVLIASMVLSKIFGALMPSLQAEYQAGIFRPWNDPLMSLYFLYPFVLGIVLAWVWDKTKSVVKGENAVKKGINFGLAYWIVASIPGMLITYSSFVVSLSMILSWTISGLVSAILAGIVFAKINK